MKGEQYDRIDNRNESNDCSSELFAQVSSCDLRAHSSGKNVTGVNLPDFEITNVANADARSRGNLDYSPPVSPRFAQETLNANRSELTPQPGADQGNNQDGLVGETRLPNDRIRRDFQNRSDGLIREDISPLGTGRFYRGRPDGMDYSFRYNPPSNVSEVRHFGENREFINADGSIRRTYENRADGLTREEVTSTGTARTYEGRADGMTYSYRYNHANRNISEVRHFGQNVREYVRLDGVVIREVD